jgi:hypothetical protein
MFEDLSYYGSANGHFMNSVALTLVSSTLDVSVSVGISPWK